MEEFLQDDAKCHIFTLAGGIGARAIQSGFVRVLDKKKDDYPVVVIDPTNLVAPLIPDLENRALFTITTPESGFSFPHEPPTLPIQGGHEHPMFVDAWRYSYSNMRLTDGPNLHKLISCNWDRFYGVDYTSRLTALIHKHKLEKKPSSFIGYLYAQVSGLRWDGGLPFLTRKAVDPNTKSFLDGLEKPLVVLHMGMDRNPQDFSHPINYRLHKVWSIQRWQELANRLSKDYTVAQIYANQINPQLSNVINYNATNLNEVLQLIEGCHTYVSIDTMLPHVAASVRKRGVVLWGSVSPYVWGWPHNTNIWNKSSCEEIACWRPGMHDSDAGKAFVCSHYSCMISITVDQVYNAVRKLSSELEGSEKKKHYRVGDTVKL